MTSLPPTVFPSDPNARPAKVPYKRIATEEAWAPRHLLERWRQMAVEGSADDPGFDSLWGFYAGSKSERATAIYDRLGDIGERRIADMDASGIDVAILSLTSPGTQIFKDVDYARNIAAESNDMLAEAIRKYPDRFAGLAAVAPQDPQHAAKEIERAVNSLGLKGVIINSHTRDEYLDDQKFWPILEAAEALDVPIYLHPNTPSRGLIKPLLEAGLDGAVYGFGVETGMHMLRIIVKGAFDRFPKLQFILGHAGEALPFWLYRLDYMHNAGLRANRYPFLPKLQKNVSAYLRENVYVTSSGMPWEPSIRFCQQVLGVDRVMYAMDYPYEFVVEEVITQDNMAIPDEDKRAFFQTNAERVFKL